MALFHDEEDKSVSEPVLGLPSHLPEGEAIVWQGRSDAKGLAIHAFHIRTVALYLGTAAVLRLVIGVSTGQAFAEAFRTSAMIAVFAAAAVAVLSLLAWSMARRSVFTITDRRVVIRHGVAFRKYINLPFKEIQSVDLRRHGHSSGDIALTLSKKASVPYLHLWPFARPMRINHPVPLLRCLTDVETASQKLVNAMKAEAPQTFRVRASTNEKTARPAHAAAGMPSEVPAS